MKANLLLNCSGLNPELISKRPRPDSVSSSCRCRVLTTLLLCLTIGVGNAWGTTLFHETFGNNTGSARTWNNSYSVKSGVTAVYSSASMSVTNAKQSKNTQGSTQSGLTVASNTTGTYVIGPLNVSSYSSLVATYKWKAASTSGTYWTKLYYKTSSGGSYTEVSGTGNGATAFVTRTYNLPAAAQVSTLYIKVEWLTSNTNALIDEFDLAGTAAASCSVNPTIGNASLNGSFNLSTVGVQCASITPGSNCSVASGDYGFIWYAGTGDKVIGDGGVTKVAVTSEAYSSGSFSQNLTGSFSVGSTYTFRAFATNGKPATVYSDAVSFTPRSVTFISNGGSSVATKYVNSGTKVSAPDAPTKTGYNFGEWQLNSSEFDFANTNVTSNITLVATWTAKTTTVSFNQNSGTGGQTSNLTAAYDSEMPAISGTPTREGYDFGGYYDGEGGMGTQYYDEAGASAKNWDKENSTWTLYAKWTIKNYTVTWKVNNTNYTTGTPTSSVNHGSHVTTLPTAPDPGSYCGDKFMGWTDATDGAYVQGTSNLYTKASDFPNATAAQTFYAVFADYKE